MFVCISERVPCEQSLLRSSSRKIEGVSARRVIKGLTSELC